MSNNHITINTSSTSFPLSGCITAPSNYSINYANNFNPTILSTSNSNGLSVAGNANFEGDVTIKGIDISKLLEEIQNRLIILMPNPEKLEKYEALKKAYNHYKLLEKLLNED
jgi:hypothetical protein